MSVEGPSYQEMLLRNRFAQAALSVSVKGQRLLQPDLGDCAGHLSGLDFKRQQEKGQSMSNDHLKQEAVKWARVRGR